MMDEIWVVEKKKARGTWEFHITRPDAVSAEETVSMMNGLWGNSLEFRHRRFVAAELVSYADLLKREEAGD